MLMLVVIVVRENLALASVLRDVMSTSMRRQRDEWSCDDDDEVVVVVEGSLLPFLDSRDNHQKHEPVY